MLRSHHLCCMAIHIEETCEVRSFGDPGMCVPFLQIILTSYSQQSQNLMMTSEQAETCRSINNNIIVNKLVVFDFLVCIFRQWYLLLQMLYMFQAVPPPIIRSSKLYTQYRIFVELFLFLAAIVGASQLHPNIENLHQNSNEKITEITTEIPSTPPFLTSLLQQK